MNKTWYPEIMYEEQDEGISSKIPFVLVTKGENMPKLLYVFESRETGEFEPGLNGEELPIVEMDLHQYADMSVLKENLDMRTYDVVRHALGLQSMDEAIVKGKKISNDIRENLKEKTSQSS